MAQQPNPNRASIQQISDQGDDGSTYGKASDDTTGFHGTSSAQFTTPVVGGGFSQQGAATVNPTSLFNGGLVDANAKGFYTIQDIVRALKEKGILSLTEGASIPV